MSMTFFENDDDYHFFATWKSDRRSLSWTLASILTKTFLRWFRNLPFQHGGENGAHSKKLEMDVTLVTI